MGKPLRAGELRHTLKITIPDRGASATGGQTLDYEKPVQILLVRAKKLPDRRQAETFEGRDLVRAVTTFDVRYRADLLDADDGRVEWRSRIFGINNIDDPDGESRRLRLYLERQQDREDRGLPENRVRP